ncbi:hypothetical protein E4U31_003008 [Claviceps sp. LM219 group G6]|nr:hypothetical protein E4U31_003008 [Claviceps sp. LM219 group G6]KAG6118612.1 hypothetical protein E4U14_006600 [Claviceps sp. LM454 group G7]
MKFSAIFGSLAIYGLQVHAIPTDLDPQAIQPVEASSPIPNTLEVRDAYCCAGFGTRRDENYVTTYIPRISGTYFWNVPYNDSECMVVVLRNPLDCSGWTFTAYGCGDSASSVDISVRPAGDCRR